MSYSPREIVLSVNQTLHTAQDLINGHFNELKRKVDLRREDLIKKISSYSDEIIKSIESTQNECLKMSKEVNQLKVEVEESKKNLNEFDFKKYSFDFKEIDIKDVFGELETLKIDSTIIEIELQDQLTKLCEFPVGQKWELKYRASRDGFKSTDFHSHCDGIANTLTVIKAKSGNIFGGFTEQEWHSRGEFVADPNAFVFSLVNKEENPFKVMCSDEYAICGNSKYGPCFGGQLKTGRGRNRETLEDIAVHSDSNTNKKSYCGLGYTYKHPDYLKDTDRAYSILAGSLYFETVEIEVFTKEV